MNESEREAEEAAKRTEEIVNNLMKIEQSLSTKYLGIFPNYLTHINELLINANPEKPTVVFEDVLYYGIFSTPVEFKSMINHLIDLAEKGSEITIAHYDIEGRIFRRIIQEQRIKKPHFQKLGTERTRLLREYQSNRRAENEGRSFYSKADSIASEKYFKQTCNDNWADFEKHVERCLRPVSDLETDRDSLFFRIDEVKRKSLNKPLQSISFQDYMDMYQGMSRELMSAFKACGVELVGLDDYLVMSCWTNDEKAILAFPSKYATDEIGFYSQDPAFSQYIFTMLEGVKEEVKE